MCVPDDLSSEPHTSKQGQGQEQGQGQAHIEKTPAKSHPSQLRIPDSFDEDVDWAAIEQIEAAHTSAKEAEAEAEAEAAIASSQASGAVSRTASQVTSASDGNVERAATTCTTVGHEARALAPWSAFASASVEVSLSQA